MNQKTNLGIRAVLHTIRKWKKTLLLFCLLLFITTLVLSGLAIADAQEEQSEELRGVTGASFTVNANNGYTHDVRMNLFPPSFKKIDFLKIQNLLQKLFRIHADHKSFLFHRQIRSKNFYHFQDAYTPFPYDIQIFCCLLI